MKVSTITTCKGRKAHLEITIPTLYTQPDEHIVVDCLCPDKSGDWIETNYPKIKVVKLDQEYFNISKARNAGAEAATSEWLCFLDADTVVSPSFMSVLKTHLINDNVFVTQRNGSLSGFVVCTKEAWSKVKYHETMEGWGMEDDDFVAGLRQQGLKEVRIVGHIGAIEHNDSLRTRHHEIKDKGISWKKNNSLRRWRHHLDEAENIQGWMSRAELTWLHEQAQLHQQVVEIGTYKGRSTWALACSGATVHCVDTWDDKDVYSAFLEKFNNFIKTGVVIPHKGTSIQLSAEMKGPYDFIFIDADHSYESVKMDIMNWLPKIAMGGIISGHDYSSSWPGVIKAVDEIFTYNVRRGSDAIWYVEC